MRGRHRVVASAVLVVVTLLGGAPARADGFDRVPVIEANVAFWRNVYAVWSQNDIAFHDREDMTVVYRVVREIASVAAGSVELRNFRMSDEMPETPRRPLRL